MCMCTWAVCIHHTTYMYMYMYMLTCVYMYLLLDTVYMYIYTSWHTLFTCQHLYTCTFTNVCTVHVWCTCTCTLYAESTCTCMTSSGSSEAGPTEGRAHTSQSADDHVQCRRLHPRLHPLLVCRQHQWCRPAPRGAACPPHQWAWRHQCQSYCECAPCYTMNSCR